ncbi:MAG: MotA/TolQ/ExbB proton channel family protein [Verrucomicrobiota bacterium]
MIEDVLYYWQTGGLLMPVLALVCYGIWFTFFRLRGALLRITRAPADIEDGFRHRLAQHTLEENLTYYEQASNTLSRILGRALRTAGRSGNAAEAFDSVQDAHMERASRDLVLLTALTAAAPLLGLLGTVIGMVSTFQGVSGTFGNTTVQVSGGISQALITTQCGLVVAIPGLFGRARIHRLQDEARARLALCRVHFVFYEERS